MYGRPLDEEKYESSRWIVEPFHLYDCCQENDGAAAMVLVAADRLKDFDKTPCYLLAAVAGNCIVLRWGLTTCGLPTCNGAVAAVVVLALSVTLQQPLRQVWRSV